MATGTRLACGEVRAAAAIGGFILASLLMVPVTLLAVIGGVVFEGWQAFIYVLVGAMGASAIGFLAASFWDMERSSA